MSDRLDLGPHAALDSGGEGLPAVRLKHRRLTCRAGGLSAEPALPALPAATVSPGDGTTVAVAEGDGVRIERHVAVPAPELLVMVDDLSAPQPRRWQWRLELPSPPVLATHARRCDVLADGHGLRCYWLVPEGIRARVAGDTLTLETTQPTREVRIAVAMLPFEGDPPLPQRFRDGARLGLRLDTAHGVISATVGDSFGELPCVRSP